MVAACPFPARRGTPQRILQIGESLNRAGYDVHVATYHLGTTSDVPGLTLHRTRHFASYHEFAAGPNWSKLVLLDPQLVRRLARVVREQRIRVIHAHHFEGALCALLVKRWLGGVRVIYDAHTTLRHEIFDYTFFKLPRFLKKVACDILDGGIPRWCDHVVTVSDRLRDYVIGQGVPAHKVTSVPLGVDLDEFHLASRGEARSALGLDHSPIVLYTGNLAEFQGVGQLLQLFPEVRKKVPGAKLVIVGGDQGELASRIGRLDLPTEAILHLGDLPFPEVKRWLAAADAVALPREECVGFPLKLVNYMAAGKAVVAFSGSGGEALIHDKNGWLVDGHDYAGFANGLIACLSDPSMAARLGSEAKNSAREYSEQALDQRVARLYRHLVEPGLSAAL